MYSALLLLASIGMMAVGAIAIIFWRLRRGTPLRYFLYGGVLWAVAIGIKLIMDYTVTLPIETFVYNNAPFMAFVLFVSLYLGLRTGLLESGITYLVARKAGWSKMCMDDAIGVGIGFGATESIILGVFALLATLPMISLSDFSLTTDLGISIVMPVWERAFTVLCHVSATALAILAVRPGKSWLLLASIALKTFLDGAIPVWMYYGQPYGLQGVIGIELYVAVIGVISIAVLLWVKKSMEGSPVSAPET